MARTMPLCESVKGSNVPGKNAIGRGGSKEKPSGSRLCSVMKR